MKYIIKFHLFCLTFLMRLLENLELDVSHIIFLPGGAILESFTSILSKPSSGSHHAV